MNNSIKVAFKTMGVTHRYRAGQNSTTFPEINENSLARKVGLGRRARAAAASLSPSPPSPVIWGFISRSIWPLLSLSPLLALRCARLSVRQSFLKRDVDHFSAGSARPCSPSGVIEWWEKVEGILLGPLTELLSLQCGACN